MRPRTSKASEQDAVSTTVSKRNQQASNPKQSRADGRCHLVVWLCVLLGLLLAATVAEAIWISTQLDQVATELDLAIASHKKNPLFGRAAPKAHRAVDATVVAPGSRHLAGAIVAFFGRAPVPTDDLFAWDKALQRSVTCSTVDRPERDGVLREPRLETP